MNSILKLRIVLFSSILWMGFSQQEAISQDYDPDRFEREILVPASLDAMQLEVLPNGDIVFVEFRGTVKRWDRVSGEVLQLGGVDTFAKGEVGLLGMAVAKDFLESGFLYVLFCPADKPTTMRVSRFTVKDDHMASSSEVELLSWPYDDEHIFHMGGAMWMSDNGDLYIGNGDNCHFDPGLPVDRRPDRINWDAYRSAANSRDYRGKILRIHPEKDGSYTTPRDNLFPDGKDGHPEIYAMGLRNPFRIAVDDKTGALYIGDVGPNILPELGINPLGYDELNVATEASNFGWPSFVGDNEALPVWDFEKNEEIERYDPASPKNNSPNNTGTKDLPPAKAALIWYPSTESKMFPTMGSGGRSMMAGPVYHFDPSIPSTIQFPKAFDGRVLIYEWMRNWIQTIDPTTEDLDFRPFMQNRDLRRPIDIKFGSDGALYMIEYGDMWWENQDSRIVRIIYRRGNRNPVAKLNALETAGRHPLTLEFDASESTDADGDQLNYTWSVDGRAQSKGSTFTHTFREPGSYKLGLTAEDPGRGSHTVTETIQVGNARPQLTFTQPAHGSFFDWETEIAYSVELSDVDSEAVNPSLVAVQGEYRNRRYASKEEDEFTHPGLALMRQSTCFSCHLSDAASAGPPYQSVTDKYTGDSAALEMLAQKILSGGTGIWGELPMPPHPQHNINQARQMVNWILSLTHESANAPKLGNQGTWTTPRRATTNNWTVPPVPGEGIRTDGGVFVLTAEYTDQGSGNAAPLRGESSVILHARKKKAALYDEASGMEYVDMAGDGGILGHFTDGDYIIWKELDLEGITDITANAANLGSRTGRIELRNGSPNGPLLSSIQIPVTENHAYSEIGASLQNAKGLSNVCVVVHFDQPDGQTIGLNWIEFN
ncbi:PQQ-dependent sugar dehydrogenase [Opitutia bacterium ISCC 51]|nr:PQQ-dependent sugar dehydrogenase [Opitutae bacterium ISCC 51]QXD29682.1 PQQ-dependent sugar dehydrogenase [Opitutae bacterium ISCC 52]